MQRKNRVQCSQAGIELLQALRDLSQLPFEAIDLPFEHSPLTDEPRHGRWRANKTCVITVFRHVPSVLERSG